MERAQNVPAKSERRQARQEELSNSGCSVAAGGEESREWFGEPNRNYGGQPAVLDSDSHFFLHPSSSSSPLSMSGKEIGNLAHRARPSPRRLLEQNSASCSDDYRSVIDDLTIENRWLRERLQMYEKSPAANLESERLFEVKFHDSLPLHVKRELIHTLHKFATSINEPPDEPKSSRHLGDNSGPNLMNQSDKKTSSSQTSQSGPFDSAYASNRSPNPHSTATSNEANQKPKHEHLSTKRKEKNAFSVSNDDAEGLVTTHQPTMTFEEKEALVVSRIEQLFTGRISGNSTDLSVKPKFEGAREAPIFPNDIDFDAKADAFMPTAQSSLRTRPLNAVPEVSTIRPSPSQRPTRPLDLDPHRTQIPSENIEYIRHLGLPAPRMVTEEGSQESPGDEGWIYLNLIMNMAQLHIINVTRDFVRSAIAKGSTKFELSEDGQKIRWNNSRNAKMSSNLKVDNDLKESTLQGRGLKKYGAKGQGFGTGWKYDFATTNQVSLNIPQMKKSPQNVQINHSLDYKPIFAHHLPSRTGPDYLEKSSSFAERNSRDLRGQTNVDPSLRGASVDSNIPSRKERTIESIIFYRGASFCTDLTGYGKDITPQSRNVEMRPYAFGNHHHGILGHDPGPAPEAGLSRTVSGSNLRWRPFKDYSKLGELRSSVNSTPKTPELLRADTPEDFPFSPEWSLEAMAQVLPPLDFEACGLGCTQPADHFIIVVKTSRPITQKTKDPEKDRATRNDLQKKLLCIISRFAAKVGDNSSDQSMDSSMSEMTSMSPDTKTSAPAVVVRILSTTLHQLEPSRLPPPALFFGADLDTEFSCDDELSNEDLAYLTHSKPVAHGIDAKGRQSARFPDRMDLDSPLSLLENDDEDDDSDIDMLAHDRANDPEGTWAREMRFDREMREGGDGSSVATDGVVSEAGEAESESESESESKTNDDDEDGDEGSSDGSDISESS